MSKTNKIVVLDTEATTYETGNPFSQPNRLMCVGVIYNDQYQYYSIEHNGLPYGGNLEALRKLLEGSTLLVGFNVKYDLHWIRKYIPNIVFPPIWDCQLAEFLLHNQRNPYPSLDFASRLYGVGAKSTHIEETYWNNGIDTDKIPENELRDYNELDCRLTAGVYEKQKELLEKQGKLTLFKLQCADLLTLQEMEYNGMLFDEEKAAELALECEGNLARITRDLNELAGCDFLNYNSPHHISVLLYGGVVETPGRETVTTVTKTGKTRTYDRNCLIPHTFPQLVAPLPNTRAKTKDENNPIYFTNEPILRSLRATGRARQIINLILEQSELEKLRGTYYSGLPELNRKMLWKPNTLHGQFNQCVARTGRIASKGPNLQNFATAIKPLFKPRNGILVNTDAKGLEWVCAAYLSQDPVARAELEAGIDHHEANRVRFGLPNRLIAKVFMFRLIYGGSAWSFANDPDFTEVSTRESYWQNVIDKTYEKYTGLGKWHENLVREVVKTGRLVMPTGRIYAFERVRGEWPRTQILNYPVQGLGADLLSIIRASLAKRIRLNANLINTKMICTVHDSILFDCDHKDVDILKDLIDNVFKDMPKNFKKLFGVEFNLPLRCETSVGANWGDMTVLK